MNGRRQFVKNCVQASLAAWAFQLDLNAGCSGVAGEAPVSVFGSDQQVQWVRSSISADAPDIFQALLRKEETTGIAVLVAFPPGWKTTEVFLHSSDEAIFVLDGDFGIGGHRVRAGQYCYLPDRMVRHDINSQNGAVVLGFFSRIARHEELAPEMVREVNRGLLVVDPWHQPWIPAKLPNNVASPSAVLTKLVHTTAEARMYLVFLAPGFMLGAEQRCNDWQEWFVLSGKLLVNDRSCGPGTYGFLKAGASIGPVCTETGALILARFGKNARLQILRSEAAQVAADSYLNTICYLPRPK